MKKCHGIVLILIQFIFSMTDEKFVMLIDYNWANGVLDECIDS